MLMLMTLKMGVRKVMCFAAIIITKDGNEDDPFRKFAIGSLTVNALKTFISLLTYASFLGACFL